MVGYSRVSFSFNKDRHICNVCFFHLSYITKKKLFHIYNYVCVMWMHGIIVGQMPHMFCPMFHDFHYEKKHVKLNKHVPLPTDMMQCPLTYMT